MRVERPCARWRSTVEACRPRVSDSGPVAAECVAPAESIITGHASETLAVLETLFSNWIIATLGIPETMTSVLVALGAAAAALPFRRLVPAMAAAATGFRPAPETDAQGNR